MGSFEVQLGALKPATSDGQRSLDERAHLEEKLITAFKKLRSLRTFAQDQHPCPVAPGLYIGSIGAAQNLEGLQRAGITHILNASPLVPCFYKGKFQYLLVDIHDDPSEDIAQYFKRTNAFVQQGLEAGGVLIHCYAGVSRSAAFTLAYMISNLDMDVSEALCLLRCSRPQAQPNSGFLLQLEQHRDMYRRQAKRRKLLLTEEIKTPPPELLGSGIQVPDP